MRRSPFTIILLTSGAAAALLGGIGAAVLGSRASASTTVYRWVDEQGVVHFSDQPHPGAQKLHVEDAPTFSAPPVRTESSPPDDRSAAARPSCAIESPTNEQMLMNAWSVSGHIRMPDQLDPGDRVVLMLDGKVLPNAADLTGSFNVPQIDRGAHTLAAQVQAPGGAVICQTPPITFYVHQPSVKAPNPVSRPRF